MELAQVLALKRLLYELRGWPRVWACKSKYVFVCQVRFGNKRRSGSPGNQNPFYSICPCETAICCAVMCILITPNHCEDVSSMFISSMHMHVWWSPYSIRTTCLSDWWLSCWLEDATWTVKDHTQFPPSAANIHSAPVPKINTCVHCSLVHRLNGVKPTLLLLSNSLFLWCETGLEGLTEGPCVEILIAARGAGRMKEGLCGLVRHEIKHVIRTNTVWLRDWGSPILTLCLCVSVRVQSAAWETWLRVRTPRTNTQKLFFNRLQRDLQPTSL